jgi:glucosyl-3-phosphoglycerate synthase
MQDVPLIDEVLVIDSGSDDCTGEVARRAGATVVRQCDIHPELGDRPGKGEALWKSLFVASGDIIAFIDADLRDFDPHFAVGLLGPLLTDPDTHFVKAIYDRPLTNGQTVLPAGGGRVTELVARPLLNLHFPELAGIVQPLAGEYAGRRSLLERLPFVSGYGVEIAMLIDVLHEQGLDSIAQVDLGCRFHRNSSDAALSRMAGQVYLALLSRLERHDRVLTTLPPHTLLTQFVRDGDRYVPQESNVAVTERPPAASVPQYHRRAAVSG